MVSIPILNWHGKRVWIIGASHGIGQALAEKLHAKGAKLTLSGRSEEKLQDLCGNLSGSIPLAVDVTERSHVAQATKNLKEQWSAVDIIIHCAGDYLPMSSEAADFDKARQIAEVNFMSYFNLLEFALPMFKERSSSHLVMVGSVAGYVGLPNGFGYCASKAAVINLAESLKVELEQSGIDVRLVSPGFVKTRLTNKNSFEMPGILSVEDAADEIIQGLAKRAFEIHFPKKFTFLLKLLQYLPYPLLFSALRKFRSQG